MLIEDENKKEFLKKEDEVRKKLRKEGPLDYRELNDELDYRGSLIRKILQDLLNKKEIMATSGRKFKTI